MLVLEPKQIYSRQEVCRLLSITERQLKSWEKQALIPEAPCFAFHDVLALQKLRKLKEDHVPPMRIRKAITAIRSRWNGEGNPLASVRVYADGKRVKVAIEGRPMDAETGQFLIDFEAREWKRLLTFPADKERKQQELSRIEAERWFQKGLEMEQTGAPVAEIIAAYEKAASLDTASAGALVNLGTIYFNARAWAQAERHYRLALAADPEYALAYFNLGNLYDERGDRARALQHYLAAIKANPNYGDAHYNIALLYQSTGQVMKALRHWRIYLRLDPSSSWATIARRELGKLRQATIVRGQKRREGTRDN